MEKENEKLKKLLALYINIFKAIGLVSIPTDQNCPKCNFPEILTLRNEKKMEKRILRYCKQCGEIVYYGPK